MSPETLFRESRRHGGSPLENTLEGGEKVLFPSFLRWSFEGLCLGGRGEGTDASSYYRGSRISGTVVILRVPEDPDIIFGLDCIAPCSTALSNDGTNSRIRLHRFLHLSPLPIVGVPMVVPRLARLLYCWLTCTFPQIRAHLVTISLMSTPHYPN